MRRASVASIVVLPIAPARASAVTFPTRPPGSPEVYVCTAAAQVVKIYGATGAKTLFANGTGSFDDCVVGTGRRSVHRQRTTT